MTNSSLRITAFIIWCLGGVMLINTHWQAFFYVPRFHVFASANLLPHEKVLPFYHANFVNTSPPESVHSAAGYADQNQTLHAYWWAGSREGAKDVSIYTSTLAMQDDSMSEWSVQRPIMTRQIASKDLSLYIKKLGNEVVYYDSRGRLWLFFVTVTAGGWATSHINVTYSDDNGMSWSRTKRLYASRFLNLSHLVKCKPIEYSDGSIGLPAYHEMAGKFSVMLQIDRHANIIDQYRITHGRYAIQPTLMIESDTQATALMRSTKKDGVLISRTHDGGKSWSPLTVSHDLPNPNAGISGLTLSPDLWLLAYNNHQENRSNLSLSVSLDQAKTWQKIHIFDQLTPADSLDYTHPEFSYPWLMQDNNGLYHVFYTWHRHRIKHVTFNHAWLMQQLSAFKHSQEGI